MTDKQIIFKCDVDCTLKNTEECLELDCIKGQESILKQLQAKEQECEELKENNAQFIKDNQFLSERNSKLKAENEELKGIRDRNFLSALEERRKAEKLSKPLPR